MKRKLLTLAVGAVIAAQFSAAQAAEVQVYGKVNVSAQNYSNHYLGMDQQQNQQLESNASRVGVKGDININDDLKAVYKLEYQLYVDDGSSNNLNGTQSDSNTFKARNNYGGLNSKTWGQLVAGKNDTPFKLIQNENLDRFNDLNQGDMQNYLVGEDRVNNMVLYTSPSFGNGYSINLQTYSNEESGNSTGTTTPNNDNVFGQHWSTSITYGATGPFYIGLAYNYDVTNADAWRLMSSYKITDNVQIAGLIQTATVHDDDNNKNNTKQGVGDGIELPSGSLNTALNPSGTTNDFNTAIEKQNAYMANVMWTIVPDKWVAYAQVGYSTNDAFSSAAMPSSIVGSSSGAEFDTTFYGIGVDRILSKKVKLFAYATDQKVDIGNNDYVNAVLIDDGTFTTGGIGMEIKF